MTAPNSSLQWTVKKLHYPTSPQYGLPTTNTSYYYGRTLEYSPSIPFHSKDSLIIFATHVSDVCGEILSTDSLHFRVTFKNIILNGYDDGDQLSISIFEESDEVQRAPANRNADSDYTLELWHNIYGRMSTKIAHTANEQMNISGFPQSTYVLLLKENGETIAQTKVQIQ